MQFLKQSVAVTMNFGPFVDPTDGFTLKTGLVAALDNVTTGIRISKNGGTLAARNGAPTVATTYDAFGIYKVGLDTTDTGTLGRLHMVFSGNSTCLPMWRDALVITPNVYDSLTNVSTFIKSDIAAINTNAGDATLLSAHIETATIGTVNTAINAATATAISCSDVTEATASHFVGKQAWQLTGAGLKQWWGVVTAYSLNTGEGRFTMSPGSPTSETPVTGNTFLFI